MTTSPAPESAPLLTVNGSVATITLNRPSVRNRLQVEDLQTLLAHFEIIQNDMGMRVTVLTANVLPKKPVFCSGFNLAETGQLNRKVDFAQVVDALENLRPVTVVAMNGSVYGGATDFALAADFAIGQEEMEMRMPAAAIGLHYYPSGIQRYVTRLGVQNAKRAFLAAEVFDDNTLLGMGYIHQLVERAQFDKTLAQLVKNLLSMAPLAQQLLKTSLNEVARGHHDAARLLERQLQTQGSADFAEGVLSFAERRQPVFKGQ